jgi:hypothetical protein
MCKAHRPSNLALYELAEEECSQKVPVSWNPVLVQKIIHPTPHKLTALFRLYDPSVVHINDPSRRPSAIHNTSTGVSLPGLIPSHIHVPPQPWRNSQNPVRASVAAMRVGPVDNLVARCAEMLVTKISMSWSVAKESGPSYDMR